MQHRAYQLARRSREQRGVRVQGQDIARPGQGLRVAGEALQFAVHPRTERGEGHQRPALALVGRPHPVAGVFAPFSYKKVKTSAVLLVQRVHGGPGGGHGARVRGHGLALRLRQVGQQGEEQVPAAVTRGAAEGLQPPRKLVRIFGGGQDGGHGADGAPLVRHAAGQLHTREYPRRYDAQQQRIKGVFGYLQRGQQRQQRRPDAARDEPRHGAYGSGNRERAKGVEGTRGC